MVVVDRMSEPAQGTGRFLPAGAGRLAGKLAEIFDPQLLLVVVGRSTCQCLPEGDLRFDCKLALSQLRADGCFHVLRVVEAHQEPCSRAPGREVVVLECFAKHAQGVVASLVTAGCGVAGSGRPAGQSR